MDQALANGDLVVPERLVVQPLPRPEHPAEQHSSGDEPKRVQVGGEGTGDSQRRPERTGAAENPGAFDPALRTVRPWDTSRGLSGPARWPAGGGTDRPTEAD